MVLIIVRINVLLDAAEMVMSSSWYSDCWYLM